MSGNTNDGDPNEARLLQMVDEARDEIIKMCVDFIKIDSVNYGQHVYNSLDEIFDFSKKILQKENIPFKQFDCPFPKPVNGKTVYYPNLIAKLKNDDKMDVDKNDGQSKTLMFCGHLDVVPYYPEAWTPGIDPIGGLIQDGKLYGRGSTDMKGGCVSMLMAMILLKRSQIDINGKLKVYLIPDEESNSFYGAQFMIKEHPDALKSDAVIIGESTNAAEEIGPVVILGEKGIGWLKLTFHGASGHGSMPKPKSSVITKINNFVHNLKDIKFKKGLIPVSKGEMIKSLLKRLSFKEIIKLATETSERPKYDEDGNDISNFFKTTITPTVISAGKKENVIPTKGELVLDIRLMPDVDSNDIFKSLADVATKSKYRIKFPDGYYQQPLDKHIKDRPVDIEVDIISTELGNFSPADNPVVQILDQSFEEIYKLRTIHFFSPGSTDGSHLRKIGLDTYIFGPGNGQTSHAEDEHIEIEDIIKATKVYLLTAYRYLK